ncbi:MAG: hypothetical protein WCW01_00580 [Gammaproteobacteria bacterium]
METFWTILSSALVSLIISAVSIALFLGKYKQKVDTHEKSLEKHDNRIIELSDRISKVEGGLDRDRAHSDYIQKKSPLGLTEKGKALLLDSTGKDYVDKHKAQLIESIKSTNPRTAYDVQELSKKVIQKESNTDDFSPLKNYIFNQGLDLNLLIDILGIYLRDIALKELGFNINDIKD